LSCATGKVTRARDARDERNVRISLTEAGRALREKGLGFGKITVDASGLTPEEFPVLQKAIARLRDNLLKAAGAAD
jgi:DNA-binding MarR family transcriptional regulator